MPRVPLDTGSKAWREKARFRGVARRCHHLFFIRRPAIRGFFAFSAFIRGIVSADEDPERPAGNVLSLIRARKRRDASYVVLSAGQTDALAVLLALGCQSWSELETSAECADPAYFHQFRASHGAACSYFIDGPR